MDISYDIQQVYIYICESLALCKIDSFYPGWPKAFFCFQLATTLRHLRSESKKFWDKTTVMAVWYPTNSWRLNVAPFPLNQGEKVKYFQLPGFVRFFPGMFPCWEKKVQLTPFCIFGANLRKVPWYFFRKKNGGFCRGVEKPSCRISHGNLQGVRFEPIVIKWTDMGPLYLTL